MGKSELEIYEALVGQYPELKVKGKKNRYTALNGNMFSFVDPTGLVCFRLSKPDKAAFEAEYGTGDVIQYNSVMNGYVPIPAVVLNDPKMREEWFDRSLKFVKSLKPKPTKKS